MTSVSIRELRNRGGDVVDRVVEGERITITRDGRPVAELRPVRPETAISAERLLERWHRLPVVDGEAFRRDVDAIIDSSL